MLARIDSPEDIKNLSQKQIDELSQEIRKTIIDVVGKNGGHLASNLGVVELTISLHRVFNSPQDAIIWDVSHQCYAHKLLTGRYKNFSSLRQKDGISGFTNPNEDSADYFISGHASTSISSALGLLVARKLQNDEGKVITTYAPSLIRNASGQISNCETTWWSLMTNFPITATLTLKGLTRPSLLMTYVKLNVWFHGGQKHISSGLYIITKQQDRIDSSGYKTTLTLLRVGEDT